MENNKITKKEIMSLIEIGKKQSLSKEILIITNTNEKEMKTFLGKVDKGGYKKTVFENEEILMNDLLNKKFNEKEIIVWDLSPKELNENKKSIISNYCSNNKIPILGAKIQNNKYNWSKILESAKLSGIPTYNKNDTLSKNMACDNTKRNYICKYNITGIENKIFNLTLSEVFEILNKKNDNNLIIQEYSEGYEIEISIIKTDDGFKIFDSIGIKISGKQYFENEILTNDFLKETNFDFYHYNKFPGIQSFLFEKTLKIAEVLEISDYGIINFRVDWQGVSKCFNISTAPSLVNFSTFKFIFDEYKLPDEDIIHLIVGTL